MVQNWTAAGDSAWDTLVKLNGRVAETRHVVLSGDGTTLTWIYVSELESGAQVHFGLSDQDTGFAWLERAFDAKSYLQAVDLNTDARLAPVSGDPRYESVRARMHLPAVR